jgi:hypothetical protein
MSSKQGWMNLLRERMTSHQQTTLDTLNTLVVVNEVEIRQRQARFAREAIDKAIEGLRTLDAKKMSTKDAIGLLRVGLQEERRALGLIDKVTYETTSDESQAQKLNAV